MSCHICQSRSSMYYIISNNLGHLVGDLPGFLSRINWMVTEDLRNKYKRIIMIPFVQILSKY